MITIGQYLQPSKHHLPVRRFVHPDTFAYYKEEALKIGFSHVASGPMVRSSYHADLQAKGQVVE
jgi:lipoic acid synthetase